MQDDTMNKMEEQGNSVPLVYFYHPITEEYLFSREAERDPISCCPLLPANATFLHPPPREPHQAAIYDAGSWTIIPDYRGETQVEIATKQLSTVEHIGPLADGYQLLTGEEAVSIGEQPHHWKEAGGQLVAIRADEKTAIDQEIMMADKRQQRAALFATVDWRAARYSDQALLGTAATEERLKLALYRQYLRDITNLPSWWSLTMQTYDNFEEQS